MNHTSKQTTLPALTDDILQESEVLSANVFANLWQQIGMKTGKQIRRATNGNFV